jgi:hypothetical protein
VLLVERRLDLVPVAVEGLQLVLVGLLGIGQAGLVGL